ncbi:phosphotransferase [Micromonospora matsumotoense]|uniref:phosphotransferase n=1 Tax=Micromonospora matsumotoense TaxID=121616 RepID=UPI003D91F92F
MVNRVLEQHRSDEATIALRAAGMPGPKGRPVSPPVARVGDSRPVLEHVAGPRLNGVWDPTGRNAPELVGDAAALLAYLHAAPSPVARRAIPERPPWDPVAYPFYVGMTDAQRQIVGELHRDTDLRAAGRRADATVLDADVWCHGDARSDNFLVVSDGPVLIDWECSGRARPEVDVAALLASVLVSDLAEALSAPHAVRQEVGSTLVTFRGLVTAALRGYGSAGGRALDAPVLGRRVGSMLIARAFARSAEYAYDRVTAMLVQLGSSLVRHPERWGTLDQRHGR